MEYNEFLDKLLKEICKVDESLEVNIQKVEKNNGIMLDGLVITKEGNNASPVIYLNEYYKAYQEDNDFNKLLNHILNSYHEATLKVEYSYSMVSNWNYVKDKVRLMLVNYEMNEKLLNDLPHEKFLDLAVTYYIELDESAEGNSSVKITNNLFSLWGISEELLKNTAYDNMINFEYPFIQSMDSIMKEMFRSSFIDGIENDFEIDELDQMLDGIIAQMEADTTCKMYVMTNKKKFRGACGILCNEVLKGFAEKINSGFYILPSSIHELILIPYDEKYNVNELRNMVMEVNRTEVVEDEVLSDKVYLYNKDNTKVLLAH